MRIPRKSTVHGLCGAGTGALLENTLGGPRGCNAILSITTDRRSLCSSGTRKVPKFRVSHDRHTVWRFWDGGTSAPTKDSEQTLVLFDQGWGFDLEGGIPNMQKISMPKLAAAVGGLALSLSAGAGIAAAQPDIGPMVNTPCTYDQAMAAVHAENPMAAQYLDQSPPNLEFLRIYFGSTPDQRTSLLNQIKNNPGIDQALPVFQQMMTSCVNY